MDGREAGVYNFVAELRRSTGFTGTADHSIAVEVQLPGSLSPPYPIVRLDFGDLVRSGGTYTLKFVDQSSPSNLFFETFGIGNEPCKNVEVTNENDVEEPTLRTDPPGFRVVALEQRTVIEQDSLALVKLFESTDGPRWTNTDNWLKGTVDTWYGVTVESNRVVRLDLGNNQLSGTIPVEVGLLNGLRRLDLFTNDLSGSIPAELGKLGSLEVLDLFDNQLTGPIPAALGNLSALWWMNLRDNQLSGSIPPALGSLSNLENLVLFNNKLSGSIPPELGNLPKLHTLYLFTNGLSGSIPAELGQLSSLENLSLRDNQLDGVIPSELGNLSNLRQLWLYNNQLDGAVPRSFVELWSLELLWLQENEFTDVPDLSSTEVLDELQVHNNRLTFEDIEPNVGRFSTFVYAPQAKIGAPRTESIIAGESLTLSFSVGGQNNVYQWFQDGAPISNATRDTYTVDAATASDAGEYTLEVTNTLATELTLMSAPITVVVETPTLTVTRPNGGETWTVGRVEPVEWTSENLEGEVQIDLLLDGNVERTITSSTANDGSFKWSIPTDLPASSAYQIRIASTGEISASDLSDESFTIEPAVQAPTVVTEQATAVASNSATLNGTVNPGGGETTVTFEYGLTNDYGNTLTAAESPLSGTSDQAVSAAIAELQPGTTYHYRVVARNDAGTTAGRDQAFTTTAPVLSVSPSELAFGTLTAGDVSAPQTVTIENAGDAPLTIANVAFQNGTDFRSENDTGEETLTPGATRTLDIIFAPQRQGAKSDQLIVESDSEESRSVSLTGTGRSAPAIAVRPDALDFGSVASDDTARKTVVIENTGDTVVEVSTLSIIGAPEAAFSTEASLPLEIEPAQVSSIPVVFTPVIVGSEEAVLEIESSAGLDAVDLSGNGLRVNVSIDLSSPVPMVSTDEPAQLEVVASVDSRPINDVLLFFRRGGEQSYQQTELQQSDAGDFASFVGAIPSEAVTERGVDYYVAFQEGDLTRTIPAERPVEEPRHLRTESATLAAGGSFEAQKYRMISVPVVPGNSALGAVLSEHGEYDPERWRLLRWDPQDGSNGAYRELQAHRGFAALNASFEPGMAFWFATVEGDGFSVEEGQSVDGAQPFRLSLEPGWNQIATPFAFPVAWNQVEGTEDLEGPWHFDAADEAFTSCCAQTLLPWDGYFVNNTTDAPVTLSIPPIEATNAATTPSLLAARRENADYAVQLIARVEGHALRDAQNYVGFMRAARNGRDRLDWAEPPPVGEHVRLSVLEGEERLAGSFKPVDTQGQFWDLEITVHVDDPFRTRKTVEIHLSETGTRPEHFERYVIDRDAGRTLAVEGGRFSVTVTREHPVRRLRLIIGTRTLAEEKSAGASLETFTNALRPNYPNPFAEQTTIEFDLKEASHVRVHIFDVLGRRVRTLLDAERPPGSYEVKWDGRNAQGARVTSGMYFCQIQAGTFEATRRMLLTR